MSFDDVQWSLFFQQVRNAIAKWLIIRTDDKIVIEKDGVRVTFEIIPGPHTQAEEIVVGVAQYHE
jgi:hypothetical protein